MRMMLIAEMDTEKANAAVKDGSLPKTMQDTITKMKPESAYFGAQDGKRTAYLVFDLKKESDIPGIAEPFFDKLGAEITLMPVMNFEDVGTGLSQATG